MNKKEKLCEEWIMKHGCCGFDLKNKCIHLYDGGLYSLEEFKVKRSRIHHFKKLPDGMVEIVCTKKKYPYIDRRAVICYDDLDSTIRYFRNLRRFVKTKLKEDTDFWKKKKRGK